jgi:hypothetical protein
MEKPMKNSVIACALLSLLIPAMALAGQTQPAPILIQVMGDSGSAQGDMVTARYSLNDVEFIGCGVRAIEDGAGGVFRFGFCQAEDAEGNQAFCSSGNDDLLTVMASISAYSFLSFSWNDLGECTRIGNSSQSFYLPAKLKGN